jgi:hypothetical protein
LPFTGVGRRGERHGEPQVAVVVGDGDPGAVDVEDLADAGTDVEEDVVDLVAADEDA